MDEPQHEILFAKMKQDLTSKINQLKLDLREANSENERLRNRNNNQSNTIESLNQKLALYEK
jgi:hypothetical protein